MEVGFFFASSLTSLVHRSPFPVPSGEREVSTGRAGETSSATSLVAVGIPKYDVLPEAFLLCPC